MKNTMKRMATVTAAGAMALGALIPAGAALADDGSSVSGTLSAVPVSTSNYYIGGIGGGYDGWGYGYGPRNLGRLFVLGSLFGGPYGNGVIGSGTSLGDLLILNQIFNRGYYY